MPEDSVDLERIREFTQHLVPHNAALGLSVDAATLEPPVAYLTLPWNEQLIGNPFTRVLHGGAITALVDAACGVAVYLAVRRPIPVATLDLRLDYLKPATPECAVRVRAECIKATHNVAFVRALAFHDAPENPIAAAAGTFMLATRRGGEG